MALLQDLIRQIDDPVLRERILQETDKLIEQKKFGLVFEEHLPECTPLYNMPIRVGSKIALKTGYVSDIYTVLRIDGDNAICDRRETHEQKTFRLDEIVVVAEFGEPIYPTLTPIDTVENAPDSNLWHTLIEADNYHALQLLEYLYAGKVDCIYIDPPYNTGAKDWKYNNDYVDSSDQYRHSKWLSMMAKRLRLAKKLLNPKDSVLIVTIDEKEYLHLGCLLEEVFQEAEIQMISSVINPKGSARTGRFSRVDEYLFFVFMGKSEVYPCESDMLRIVIEKERRVRWAGLMRNGEGSTRARIPSLFYPIFIDEITGKFHSIGKPLKPDQDRTSIISPKGTIAMFPVSGSGQELQWRLYPPSFMKYLEKGYIRFGKRNQDGTRSVSYLQDGMIKKIENGQIIITGRNPEGDLELEYADSLGTKKPATVWNMVSHSASEHGSTFIKNLLLGRKFVYPKSLYAVRDTIRFVVKDKPGAIILDFFAGSGTTLHAVNLLNAEDGGHRRCITVTNNEVSADEAKALTARGYQPGDEEWEKLGIARYVNWPRTVCSIEGHDINGNPLKGNYIGSDIPMADGLKANAAFFKLSFLDKTSVALGKQFAELLPVLWMKGGAIGRCPVLNTGELPPMLLMPENKMAVLIDETYYSEFDDEIRKRSEIQTVFIVTDSETAYREMIRSYDGKDCYQLYRDYLDNFRINTGR
ncbi:site-specific DNA-methyltransferase [Clostridiaceae bacterium]|nr:site-specific DNA-methyltransferase [Clostridiaceae bacterium]RKI08263.1 site-specific DNA-methyltransferase [bacterium 1XD21-70]